MNTATLQNQSITTSPVTKEPGLSKTQSGIAPFLANTSTPQSLQQQMITNAYIPTQRDPRIRNRENNNIHKRTLDDQAEDF